jgi:hypothetical protein
LRGELLGGRVVPAESARDVLGGRLNHRQAAFGKPEDHADRLHTDCRAGGVEQCRAFAAAVLAPLARNCRLDPVESFT